MLRTFCSLSVNIKWIHRHRYKVFPSPPVLGAAQPPRSYLNALAQPPCQCAPAQCSHPYHTWLRTLVLNCLLFLGVRFHKVKDSRVVLLIRTAIRGPPSRPTTRHVC